MNSLFLLTADSRQEHQQTETTHLKFRSCQISESVNVIKIIYLKIALKLIIN